MSTGLILIDLQNDYFPGGKLELLKMEHAADNAKRLLSRFRKSKLPLFHIQHVALQPNAPFFQPNTAGVEINASVAPAVEEVVIQKHFPNSFRDTGLLKFLKSAAIEELVICGAMSHMCIDATTRAAFDLGFKCIVVEDACTTRDLQHKDRKIGALEVHGALCEGSHPKGLFGGSSMASGRIAMTSKKGQTCGCAKSDPS